MTDSAYLSDQARDLTLFHYDGCYYCAVVREALAELGLVIDERNILADPSAREEIVEARGRRTVPVLRIGDGSDGGEARYMGESKDIVRYLYDRFGDGKGPPSLWDRLTGRR